MPRKRVLVHLVSGIGNIILATPLIRVLGRSNFIVDLVIDADYPGLPALFQNWSLIRKVYDRSIERVSLIDYDHILPAIPPFYWMRYRQVYRKIRRAVSNPNSRLFYQNEQAYYLDLAKQIGCDIEDAPYYFIPTPEGTNQGDARRKIVLAPGSKPGEMAAKRWPLFSKLAELCDNCIAIGTANDLERFDGSHVTFPRHVQSYIGKVSLGEAAVIIAEASVVVANDSGLGHLSGALGIPTVLLFGPTPHETLGPLPPNVIVLRSSQECQACWFLSRFVGCGRRIDCLNELDVATVVRQITTILPSGKRLDYREVSSP